MQLKNLKFAEVQGTTHNSNPSASVRKNGKIMFSDSAAVLIGYNGTDVNRLYFKLGTIDDQPGVVYLVPATDKDGNTLKAAKNNASFQFNNVKTIAAVGMQINTRYSVQQIDEDGTILYKLTLKTAAEKTAEDAANVKAHVPAKTDAEIKSAMDRRTPLQPAKAPVKPTQKELAAAAKKAAKADFKAAK